jgi:hypothetical protein
MVLLVRIWVLLGVDIIKHTSIILLGVSFFWVRLRTGSSFSRLRLSEIVSRAVFLQIFRKNVEVKMSKSSPYCVLVKNMRLASYDVFNSDFAKLVMFQIFTSQ